MAGEEEHDPDVISYVWFRRSLVLAILFAIAAYLVVKFW